MKRSGWLISSSTATAGLIVVAGLVQLGQPAYAASAVTINGSSMAQQIDGFGFSQAFGKANTIKNLPAATRQQVLDRLLSPTTGAGLSILRLGIDTEGHLIQANNPGGPNATPKYSWDSNDGGQVWLAQQVKSYGASRFYADSWSAPAYMKTNNSLVNGGVICGLSGASCAGGDWTKAYANYLVQYAKYYGQEGIKINELGFTNEPNWTTDYASMKMTPAQVAQMAAIAGPIVTGAGYKLACCDAVGWASERDYSKAVVANSTANQYVSLHTGHSYGSYPTSPMDSGGKHTWMSEWSPDGTAWDTAWDDGSTMSGLSMAQSLHTALTGGQVNGFVYWYGLSDTPTTRAFMRSSGTNVEVAKRLSAMASYSRYIRPGADRIGASTGDANLKVSAYKNVDGSVVVIVLNTGTGAASTTYSLQNTGIASGTATPYLTNSSNDLTKQGAVQFSTGAFTASVPARSLVTYRITGGASPSTTPPVTTTPVVTTPVVTTPVVTTPVVTTPVVTTPVVTTPVVTTPVTTTPGTSTCRVGFTSSAWNTGLTAAVSITNTGSAAINGWTLGFTLPAGQTITSGWNATFSPTSGSVKATSLAYNAALASGASVSIGFQADHTGNTAAPTGFTLNGSSCTTA